MTEVVYHGFENEDQQARIAELLEGLRPLFPHDLRHIHVWLQSQIAKNDNSSPCSVNVGNMEYLFFDLYIYFPFFDVPREKQRAKLIHELIHAIQAPLNMFARDSLIDYVKAHNPDLGAYCAREHTQHVERFTQRFAFAIDDMIASIEARRTHDHGPGQDTKDAMIAAITAITDAPNGDRARDHGPARPFTGAPALGAKTNDKQN